MKLSSLRISPAVKPWLLAALVALPLTSACGDDEAPPAPPTTFTLDIVGLDADGAAVAAPHCDGTLAVTVAITPRKQFILQPPHACGSSGQCGFVRAEALTSDGTVLATAESVTTTAVLQIEPTRLPDLAKVRASLVRGVDGELVTNPDQTEVTTEIEPTVQLPADCEPLGAGGQGAGGQGAGGQGGAPGEPGGASAGGAGGGSAGAGGAGGAGAPSEGGASNAGAPSAGGDAAGGSDS